MSPYYILIILGPSSSYTPTNNLGSRGRNSSSGNSSGGNPSNDSSSS